MSFKLSPAEQETIILWDNEKSTCTVYTHDPRMRKRLAVLAEKYPDVYLLERGTANGPVVTYRLPKKLVLIRAPFGEDRKKRYRELALVQNRRPPDNNRSYNSNRK